MKKNELMCLKTGERGDIYFCYYVNKVHCDYRGYYGYYAECKKLRKRGKMKHFLKVEKLSPGWMGRGWVEIQYVLKIAHSFWSQVKHMCFALK